MAAMITPEYIKNLRHKELVEWHHTANSDIDAADVDAEKDMKEKENLRAAFRKKVMAAVILGRYYMMPGEHQDLPEAWEQFKFASNYDPYACFYAGKLLLTGVNDWNWDKNCPIEVLPKRPLQANNKFKHAVKEFQKPVYVKSACAQECLGFCYENGLGGLKQDYNKAREHYHNAVKLGNYFDEAEQGLNYCNYILDQIASSQLGARATKENDPAAQFDLAQRYFEGRGVERSYRAMLHFLNMAVKNSYAPAAIWLGSFYSTGLEDLPKQSDKKVKSEVLVQKDEKKAFLNFFMAANQKHPNGEYQVGRCFEKGLGMPKDVTKAVNWYFRAAFQNNFNACFALAKLCLKDLIGNRALGLTILKKLAKINYPTAQYDLGLAYYHGRLIDKDLKLAQYWLKKAETHGLVEEKVMAELEQTQKNQATAVVKMEDDAQSSAQANSANTQLSSESSLYDIITKLYHFVLAEKMLVLSQTSKQNNMPVPDLGPLGNALMLSVKGKENVAGSAAGSSSDPVKGLAVEIQHEGVKPVAMDLSSDNKPRSDAAAARELLSA